MKEFSMFSIYEKVLVYSIELIITQHKIFMFKSDKLSQCFAINVCLNKTIKYRVNYFWYICFRCDITWPRCVRRAVWAQAANSNYIRILRLGITYSMASLDPVFVFKIFTPMQNLSFEATKRQACKKLLHCLVCPPFK